MMPREDLARDCIISQNNNPMDKLKLLLNTLCRLFGYQLSRFDQSEYTFRQDMYSFVRNNYSDLIKGKVLDIGSSYGSWAKETFSESAQVTTIDMRPGSDVIGDVMSMPFKDSSFDCVFCFETIEHVKNPFIAIAEIKRILKPGGVFIGSTPFMHELHGEDYGDYWRPTRQAWELLLEGFESKEIRPLGRKKLAPHHYLVKAIK